MKWIVAGILISMGSFTTMACTTFCLNKNGQLVFGRNYDWVTGAGIVYTNQRGLAKISDETNDGNKINWISEYGSITFNQYGKEFPMGGMNEKGLVVELMWLDGTRYPEPDARPAFNVLQWIQYQLDNAASVEEVIASDTKIRISSEGTPLHYLVADASGNLASIEFLNGRMIVHKNKELPFPVLTNSIYEESAQTAKSYLNNNKSISGLDNSQERFVKACRMVKSLNESNIDKPLTDYAFSILDNVAQGDFTKWSIVYDISNRKIFFKTDKYPSVKSLSLTFFDFSCNKDALMFNMNQPGKGAIGSFFRLRDNTFEKNLLLKVVKESSDRVTITQNEMERILRYPQTISCK